MRLFTSVLFAAALAAFSYPALAQEIGTANIVCGPSGSMISRALELYGASPAQAGISAGGEALSILVLNEETGEWAWIVQFPKDGHECVFASGEGWDSLAPKKKGSF